MLYWPTVKAYHYVMGGKLFVESILKGGYITPAKDRLNWETAKTICDQDIAEMEREKGVSKVGLEAFVRVVREQIKGLRRHHGFLPWTTLHCEDFVAGDLENIFFSVGDWPEGLRKFRKLHRHKGPESIKNGFVFDAVELVSIGGRLRLVDFGFFYQLLLGVVFPKMFKEEKFAEFAGSHSAETVSEAIDMLDTIRNKMMAIEFRGDDALTIFQEGRIAPGRSEIVLDGPLSTDHATEIWVEGELIESR